MRIADSGLHSCDVLVLSLSILVGFMLPERVEGKGKGCLWEADGIRFLSQD